MLTEEPIRTTTLSDGTSLDELFSVAERSLAARVLSDPEIYRLEMEQIFDKEWIFVAHESEIPNPGDYVARSIGEDPVVVTRDDDGAIHVFLNACSHRGAEVCTTECGNAVQFKCPYHAWVYDNTGRLVGASGERELFGDSLNKSSLGLKRARVDSFEGLIFATWNEHAVSLEERFGIAGFYVKLLFGVTDNGMEVAGPPLRWIAESNWKLPADNLCGDGYHVQSVHRSMGEVGLVPGIENPSWVNDATTITDETTGDGILLARLFPIDQSNEDVALTVAASFRGFPQEFLSQIRRNLTPEQLKVYMKGIAGGGNLFPNLAMLAFPWPTGDPTEGFSSMLLLRLAQPLGPDRHVVWSWAFVPKDLDPEQKLRQAQTALRFFGSSGLLEQDDCGVWATIQKAASGVQGRQRRFNYLLTTPPDSEWPGPGVARTGYSGEDAQINYFRNWLERLTADR
jgi:phenylpropionate dioxygenase-like ring-hydroxylating dioxygenase large terminal subunit